MTHLITSKWGWEPDTFEAFTRDLHQSRRVVLLHQSPQNWKSIDCLGLVALCQQPKAAWLPWLRAAQEWTQERTRGPQPWICLRGTQKIKNMHYRFPSHGGFPIGKIKITLNKPRQPNKFKFWVSCVLSFPCFPTSCSAASLSAHQAPSFPRFREVPMSLGDMGDISMGEFPCCFPIAGEFLDLWNLWSWIAPWDPWGEGPVVDTRAENDQGRQGPHGSLPRGGKHESHGDRCRVIK